MSISVLLLPRTSPFLSFRRFLFGANYFLRYKYIWYYCHLKIHSFEFIIIFRQYSTVLSIYTKATYHKNDDANFIKDKSNMT